jgi:hypothetical protein
VYAMSIGSYRRFGEWDCITAKMKVTWTYKSMQVPIDTASHTRRLGCTVPVSPQLCHSQLTYAHSIPNVICVAPPEDEQVVLETCRGLWFSINWMESASRWFHCTDILWCTVSKTLCTPILFYEITKLGTSLTSFYGVKRFRFAPYIPHPKYVPTFYFIFSRGGWDLYPSYCVLITCTVHCDSGRCQISTGPWRDNSWQ